MTFNRKFHQFWRIKPLTKSKPSRFFLVIIFISSYQWKRKHNSYLFKGCDTPRIISMLRFTTYNKAACRIWLNTHLRLPENTVINSIGGMQTLSLVYILYKIPSWINASFIADATPFLCYNNKHKMMNIIKFQLQWLHFNKSSSSSTPCIFGFHFHSEVDQGHNGNTLPYIHKPTT